VIGRIWSAMMLAGSARFWAQVGAGVALSGLLMGYGLVIWLGPWPATSAGKQLDLLGQGQLIAGFLVLVALACITGTKVNFNASRSGVSANVDGDDEPQSTTVETTVTVTEQPK
jgi:hypothetical protein